MREPLNRERVLAAAVGIADTEGIPALTMRRLAADLGVEAMSLYYHLPGKNSLLDGLVEMVVGEVMVAIDHVDVSSDSAADPGTGRGRKPRSAGRTHPTASGPTAVITGDWRAQLRRWFLTARDVMITHPWAPSLMTTGNRVPPGIYTYYERILATLVDAGFSYHIAHRAMHAFGSMPLGFVKELFNPSGEGAEAELTEADLAAMAEQLPHMAAMVASEVHSADDPTLGWCDSQVEFEFTLDLLLDGLENFRNPPATP